MPSPHHRTRRRHTSPSPIRLDLRAVDAERSSSPELIFNMSPVDSVLSLPPPPSLDAGQAHGHGEAPLTLQQSIAALLARARQQTAMATRPRRLLPPSTPPQQRLYTLPRPMTPAAEPISVPIPMPKRAPSPYDSFEDEKDSPPRSPHADDEGENLPRGRSPRPRQPLKIIGFDARSLNSDELYPRDRRSSTPDPRKAKLLRPFRARNS